MSTDTKKQLKKYISNATQAAIYIGVGYFMFTRLDGNWEQITQLSDINWWYLTLALIFFAAMPVFNGGSWYYLMAHSTGKKGKKNPKITLANQIDVYLRSYMLRYIPGNVVGIAARGVLNKKYNIPVIKSLWGWFIENLIQVMIGIMIGAFVIPMIPLTAIFSYWLVVAIFIGGFAVVLGHDILKYIFKKLLLPRIKSVKGEESVLLDIPLWNRMVFMGLFLIGWVLYSISFLFTVAAFGVTPNLVFTSINALAWAVGYLSIVTPGGSGVREFAMIYLLGSAGGLTPELATVIAIAARLINTFGDLLGYGVFKLIYKIKKWK